MNNELIEKVKDAFSTKITSSNKLAKAISIADESLIEELNKELSLNPDYEKLTYLIIAICKDITLKKCKECGKIIPYSKRMHDFCSGKCAQKSSITKKKSEDTCMKHFGVRHPTESKDVLNTRDENNLKKYGTTNLRDVKEIDDKIKKSLIEKYGATTPAKNDIVKEKIKKTCIERYGVEYSGASAQKIEKTKETFLKKYGGHPLQNDDIRNKITLKNRSKYYKDLVEKCRRFDIEPLFTIDEYVGGYGIDRMYKCHCNRCNEDFESYIELVKTSSDHYDYLPRCPYCSPIEQNISYGEKELLEYINTLLSDVEILENNREILNGKELDIYIPSMNIAFEFNGTYWHSFEKKHYVTYHQDKTNACKEKGIRLVHIFEYDWMFKKDILKNKIKNILGLSDEKIYARKCKVKEIDSKMKNEFLNRWHIQGEDKSKVNIGLFYENDLVAVMTFGKPRFNKKYQWELIRYATSRHVLGGAGKLLKYFEDNYSPTSIITYADYSFSIGNMYRKIGFNEIGLSSPSYVYIKNNMKYSRYQCQKGKLKKLLGERFNENLSEDENMKNAGFIKIYDCGNLIFVK